MSSATDYPDDVNRDDKPPKDRPPGARGGKRFAMWFYKESLPDDVQLSFTVRSRRISTVDDRMRVVVRIHYPSPSTPFSDYTAPLGVGLEEACESAAKGWGWEVSKTAHGPAEDDEV